MAMSNEELERVERGLEILQISPPTSLVEKLEGRDTEELVERTQVLRTVWKNSIKKAQETPAETPAKGFDGKYFPGTKLLV